MKSSFLVTLVFSALMISVASAQTKSTSYISTTEVIQKTDIQKFSDRLRIGYFGVFTSPTFYDMEHGNWESAAISPETDRGRGEMNNQDTWPMNLWNQVSFNYNFGAKMNFVVNPRWMTPLASTKNMDTPEDPSFIELEDILFGFQGVVYSSTDKKFNLWIRPAMRLPTSRGSRNSSNGGFGATTHNIELGYLPTYDINTTWQVGIFGQMREWVYNDRYNWSRFRFYTAPFVQYTINDTSRVQVYYENMLENQRRWKSINGKKPVFEDVWQNAYAGYSKDITPKFNVMPFISCFVNDVPISNRSFWLGAWISYQIK